MDYKVGSCYLNSSVIFFNLIHTKTGTTLLLVMFVHTCNNSLMMNLKLLPTI